MANLKTDATTSGKTTPRAEGPAWKAGAGNGAGLAAG
jgi:hypothetical protein